MFIAVLRIETHVHDRCVLRSIGDVQLIQDEDAENSEKDQKSPRVSRTMTGVQTLSVTAGAKKSRDEGRPPQFRDRKHGSE